ncbi:ATP-dependent_NAD(P)H-hydrate dehydratase [Hexamita inflata]|uniref:ATP-dependent (S)-NAD(P)H-hydrate dehydratase n=1 Tax=Hexamita inflata TaxID=28002 RepID=A0AA86RCI4_9EUKA|nr:ATP-dependent NAD(P)H-hydrate dehydratase [Hexamita inflata]
MPQIEVHDGKLENDRTTVIQYDWKSEDFNQRMNEIRLIAEQHLRVELMQTDRWVANIQFRVGKRVIIFDEISNVLLSQTRSIIVFKDLSPHNLSVLIKKVLIDETPAQNVKTINYSKYFLRSAEFCNCIPRLSPVNSKGKGGRPLLVVGSQKYHGAAILSALACSRTGSDYTYLITHGDKLNVISQASPDIITQTYGPLCQKEDVMKLPFTSALIGSGLDRNESAQKLFFDTFEITQARKTPLVIDADGLHFLGVVLKQKPDILQNLQFPLILTPNQREFNNLYLRIFNEEAVGYNIVFLSPEVNGHYVKIDLEPAIAQVKKLADKLECCILVKNIVDICCYKGHVRITKTFGQPKRCSGQGDLLGGVLACLINWGTNICDQAIFGCEVVKRAGAKAYAKHKLGTVAYDLIAEIPDVIYEMVPENLQGYDLTWE